MSEPTSTAPASESTASAAASEAKLTPATPGHRVTYLRFLRRCFGIAFDGPPLFYAWMTLLTAVALVGLHAACRQLAEGLGITAMTDHVSWGMYIANLTYLVGLAAGAVMMVIPAYLYGDHEMHDVVIVGEILAIAAIVMCLLFVGVDIGRPDRFWHMLPGIGRFHWPMSMLTWDVIVMSGYLLLNLHISGYLVYQRYLGRRPEKNWYLPFVMLSIVWAVSIHTVTAFLYAGLGGRPFWNSAILAPRFIASAFVTGPAFIVLALQVLRRATRLPITDGPIGTLVKIMRVTVLLNLFFLLAELFTEFYTGSSHVASARYLYFGLHGKNALVPWIWTAIVFNVTAAALLLTGGKNLRLRQVSVACALALVGVWIEKGMGLIVPGFVPSTLHEVVEYTPNLVEWKVTAGIWAFGLMIFTLGLKVVAAVFAGDARFAAGKPGVGASAGAPPASPPSASPASEEA